MEVKKKKRKIIETESRKVGGVEGSGVLEAGGYTVSVLQDEKMLGTDRCSKEQVHLIPRNCTPEMANVVNFMLCVFYHKHLNLKQNIRGVCHCLRHQIS